MEGGRKRGKRVEEEMERYLPISQNAFSSDVHPIFSSSAYPIMNWLHTTGFLSISGF